MAKQQQQQQHTLTDILRVAPDYLARYVPSGLVRLYLSGDRNMQKTIHCAEITQWCMCDPRMFAPGIFPIFVSTLPYLRHLEVDVAQVELRALQGGAEVNALRVLVNLVPQLITLRITLHVSPLVPVGDFGNNTSSNPTVLSPQRGELETDLFALVAACNRQMTTFELRITNKARLLRKHLQLLCSLLPHSLHTLILQLPILMPGTRTLNDTTPDNLVPLPILVQSFPRSLTCLSYNFGDELAESAMCLTVAVDVAKNLPPNLTYLEDKFKLTQLLQQTSHGRAQLARGPSWLNNSLAVYSDSFNSTAEMRSYLSQNLPSTLGDLAIYANDETCYEYCVPEVINNLPHSLENLRIMSSPSYDYSSNALPQQFNWNAFTWPRHLKSLHVPCVGTCATNNNNKDVLPWSVLRELTADVCVHDDVQAVLNCAKQLTELTLDFRVLDGNIDLEPENIALQYPTTLERLTLNYGFCTSVAIDSLSHIERAYSTLAQTLVHITITSVAAGPLRWLEHLHELQVLETCHFNYNIMRKYVGRFLCARIHVNKLARTLRVLRINIIQPERYYTCQSSSDFGIVWTGLPVWRCVDLHTFAYNTSYDKDDLTDLVETLPQSLRHLELGIKNHFVLPSTRLPPHLDYTSVRFYGSDVPLSLLALPELRQLRLNLNSARGGRDYIYYYNWKQVQSILRAHTNTLETIACDALTTDVQNFCVAYSVAPVAARRHFLQNATPLALVPPLPWWHKISWFVAIRYVLCVAIPLLAVYFGVFDYF